METPNTGAPSRAPDSHNILIAIRKACRTHGIGDARFGRLAMGDPRLVLDLERGRKLRAGTEARLRQFIERMGGALPSLSMPRRSRRAPIAQPPIDPILSQFRHREAMKRCSAMLLLAIHRARKEA
jgi:hypothetical protein